MFVRMISTQLKSHKIRTILTIVGIVIGVFLITSSVALSESVKVSIEEGIGFLSDKIYVIEEDAPVSLLHFVHSTFDEDLAREISQTEGIERAEYLVSGTSSIGMLNGLDWSSLGMFESFGVGLSKGVGYADDANEIVVGKLIEENNGYTVGDSLNIRGEKYAIMGVFKSFGNPTDDASYFTSFKTGQKILGVEGEVNVLIVEPYNPEDVEELAKDIEDEFDGVSALVEKDVSRIVNELYAQLRLMSMGVGSIAAIIAAIVIMNVMFMNVRERTGEIGTMKAVGATDRQVLIMIIGEAMFMALIGGVIGLGLSFVAVHIVNSVVGSRFAAITLRLALQSLLLAAFLGVVGGALPAKKAAELEPVVALRYE